MNLKEMSNAELQSLILQAQDQIKANNERAEEERLRKLEEERLRKLEESGVVEEFEARFKELKKRLKPLAKTHKVTLPVTLEFTATGELNYLHNVLNYGDSPVEHYYDMKISGLSRVQKKLLEEAAQPILEEACEDFFRAFWPQEAKEVAKVVKDFEAFRQDVRDEGLELEDFCDED